ncbi:MAG: alpha-E domain-containing protein [bacterium]|nr:alpha-E domain-containing protein [bacterium]
MLSRVAESVYWLGRYMERADNTARLLDVHLMQMYDFSLEEIELWGPLISVTGDEEDFKREFDLIDQANVLQFLTFSKPYHNSILNCAIYARENARSIRETISKEIWEAVNHFYHLITDRKAPTRMKREPDDFFGEIRKTAHLFSGVIEGTQSRSQSWHFLNIGRMLERADKTSRILDVKSFAAMPKTKGQKISPFEGLIGGALLNSASALEMYKKRFRQITPSQVVEFLVLDPLFPRSIHFCLTRAENSLHAISGTPVGAFSNAPEKLIGKMRSGIDYTEPEDIFEHSLHKYLDQLQGRLNKVGHAVSECFFA